MAETKYDDEIRVKVNGGQVIITEEGIVFSGPVDGIPLLADPVEELRGALAEIERLNKVIARQRHALDEWESQM